MALVKEPWTATVSWAQAWRRPQRLRSMPAAPDPVARTPAVPRRDTGLCEAASDPVLDSAWLAATTELAEAGAALLKLQSAPNEAFNDPWPELVARHALFRAHRRVRAAQDALTGSDAGFSWVNETSARPLSRL